MLSTGYAYRREDYHFARHHTGAAPEPLPPMRPLWWDIASGAGFACFVAVVIILTHI